MNVYARRGACPALSAPMLTGDGLLVRLNPVAGGLLPKALIGLCKAALRHGNGVMEVTARGSLQIRGLTPESASLLAADVDALGIAVRTGVPVETGPLAGLDPQEIAGPAPLAGSIRAAIEAAGLEARLGPKVSVVVDGGGRSGMDAVSADVRLTAEQHEGGVLWRLAIAGDAETATPQESLSEDEACLATLRILSLVAARGIDARARDLPLDQVSRVQAKPGRREMSSSSLCVFALSDGRFAAGVALPFGHADAEQLIDFAEQAETLGVGEIRLAPKRMLIVLCPSQASAVALRESAEALGFVTQDSDPRTGIAACPGKPACASGHIAARDIAAEIATRHGDILDRLVTLHISGCAKGCAHPAKAALTLVGSENGAGLVVGGTAKSPAGRLYVPARFCACIQRHIRPGAARNTPWRGCKDMPVTAGQGPDRGGV